jgi:putative hydrolase of the HAD superfamily
MGCDDADALALRLYEVARSLRFAIYPDPAAEHVLSRLKANGLHLGVISNHRGTLKENLDELGVLRFFDVILDSHIVGFRKPDPEIFLMACRVIGVEPQDAVYVGDEPVTDVAGARRAGLGPILVDPLALFEQNDAEATIASLSQLERVLQRT